MFLIKRLLVFSLCIFLYHTLFYSTLSATDSESESVWVKINSITTKGSDFTIGKKILFESSFQDPGEIDEYSIVWDFGDGTISTGTLTTSGSYANPGRCTPYKNLCHSVVKATNVYTNPGSYTVTFSVENSEGIRHEVSETIEVVKSGR